MTWGAVAVGGATLVAGYMGSQAAGDAATIGADASMYAADLQDAQFQQTYGDLAPYREAGYGALDVLTGYGESQVDPSQYIPSTSIPQYQPSMVGDMPAIQSDIPQFDVTGAIPEFDSTQFDIYKDPSYDWRKEEMLRGLDRTAGATGKITSGNRLEEIMARSGEMASQEYGAARSRMVQDYDIRRQNEQSQYGRDVYGYERGYGAEAAQYGRGVDEYGRAYARDVDQYGRDLTAYNALTAQEAGTYGRGVDAYGRAYGQETDYLNRQSSLAGTGQAAVGTGAQAGSQAAYYGGQAVQAAGTTQAAGTLGQTAAWTNVLGDAVSAYGASQAPTYGGYGGYNPYAPSMNYSSPTGQDPNQWISSPY